MKFIQCLLDCRCDADPAALAKYVLALAKKEKPESELRGAMCDQLDVFLQQETKGFVDKLFNTLETKSYLQSNPEPPSIKPEPITEPTNPGIPNGQNIAVVQNLPPAAPTVSVTSTSTDSRAKKTDRSKRRSWSPRSRSRSRSRDRDRDRTRRSRSRDRSTRDRGGRGAWDDRRNRRSPVSSRRSDRRRSRSPLPPRRSSRSPRRRPRSPAPASQIALDTVAPPAVLVPTDAGVVPVPSVATATAIQSVVVAPPVAVRDRQKFRCRDYDEKGYCMRGDLCLYDHGTDPVILEDVELSSMLNYNRPPPPMGAGATAPLGPPPVGPPPHLRGPPPSLPPPGKIL